jgi:hypothetical protein
MTDDESELQRLLALLGDAASRLSADAAEREAISKGMLALVVLFAEERRGELENAYRDVGGSKPRAAEELEFSLRDPELWARILQEFPELRDQILKRQHVEDSMGAFLKRTIEEVEKRRASPNVSKFPSQIE